MQRWMMAETDVFGNLASVAPCLSASWYSISYNPLPTAHSEGYVTMQACIHPPAELDN